MIYFVATIAFLFIALRLFRRSRLFDTFRQLVFGMARVQCGAPRYTANVAKMMPAILRETQKNAFCTRWKHHDGEHEANAPEGENNTSIVVRW